MALLTCENVAVGYENAAVVEGLNFAVERGDYLYIVGENGSGKSTLMKTVHRPRSDQAAEGTRRHR